MKKAWVLFCLCLWLAAPAQTDSTAPIDTAAAFSILPAGDTASAGRNKLFQNPIDTVAKPAFSFFFDSALYNHQPYLNFRNPVMRLTSVKAWQGKEPLFYATIALLIFFALVRNNYSRYASDLFSLFFRTTIKQRQIKEQLVQAPLPSLLLNILFFITGSLFLNLLLAHYGLSQRFAFWLLFAYGIAALVMVYLIKFVTLQICGWLFHISDVTDAYTFVVFTTNKVIGIALLPFVVLLAFTNGPFQQAIFTLSVTIVVVLFGYRFYLSYVTIERQLKISFFHFLLYLVAFEIVPLLLINKLLFRFLGDNT